MIIRSESTVNLAVDHKFIGGKYLGWYETFSRNPQQSTESLYLKWTISRVTSESSRSFSSTLIAI